MGLTTLAAEAFNQPTPTISTASHSGTAESSNAHSRNTSASLPQGQAHGHARNTSWGKVALKKLCASEQGISDSGVDPHEKLEGALMHEKTARMHVRGRKEEAEEADVQFMDIAPLPEQGGRNMVEDRANLQNANVSTDALDVPAVGIALSTPTNLSVNELDLPDLSTHPYAQPFTPRRRAGPVPVSAVYAGPHPTSPEYNTNKHRLPPHAQQQQDIKPPETRMYAVLQSGAIRQVSTPEINQSPVSSDRELDSGFTLGHMRFQMPTSPRGIRLRECRRERQARVNARCGGGVDVTSVPARRRGECRGQWFWERDRA